MRSPRRVAFAMRHFRLHEVHVLDVGCGQGEHWLISARGRSDSSSKTKARAKGLDVRQADVTSGVPQELRDQFDVVSCSNILENVLRPDEFLIGMRGALRPGGVFLAVVPMRRLAAVGPWRGFLAADQVNFFTPRTLRLTLERVGFRVVFLGSASLPWAPRWLARLLRFVSPNVLVAGVPVPDLQYPDKAHKRLDEGGRIVFRR